MAYFSGAALIWNFLDIVTSVTTIYFSVEIIFELELDYASFIVGGTAVFTLWLKLLYFMRLFRPTAAFIRMIVEMLLDIRIFLLIFFIAIFAFANAYYVFDLYTELYNIRNLDSYEKATEGSYMQVVIYTYLQSLGELGFDKYNASYTPTVFWIVFFISTLLLQITLLNLLIAIMGDTFGRVLEV